MDPFGPGTAGISRELHYIQKHLPPRGEILDNGAGPGKYAVKLAQQGYYVTLTDLTPRFVEMAQAKAQSLNLTHQPWLPCGQRHFSPL